MNNPQSQNDAYSKWEEMAESLLPSLVPPLSNTSHKGSSGRIGVLGGSERYTGAPYYAAMSSLKVGSDLAFVFCAEEASVAIKCYSPELMVAGVYSAREFERVSSLDGEVVVEERNRLVDKMVSEVTSLFDRMHVLVIGPGLGRCPLVMAATARIISQAQDADLPLVLDADALYLVSQPPYQHLLSKTCRKGSSVVLTPNEAEHRRLVQAFHGTEEEEDEEDLGSVFSDGVIVVRKGYHDTILSSYSKDDASGKRMVCREEGGMKRSGGIGDILSGTIGTFVAWNRILHHPNCSRKRSDYLPLAIWGACCVTKRATRTAFHKKRRGMTAPDVLDEIGAVVDSMTTRPQQS